MSKFKPGDRVVRFKSGSRHAARVGDRGTIVKVIDMSYVICHVLWEHSKQTTALNQNYLVLESVYNSTLYQAMRDDE